jgi:hypothetical protein
MKILFFLHVLLFSLMLSSCGEKTYEDCVLEHSNDLRTDGAANAIVSACYKKYGKKIKPNDEKPCDARELTNEEMKKLAGKGDVIYTSFSGSIYNGNSNLKIKKITIAVKYKESGYLDYSQDISINPNSSENIDVKALPRDNEYGSVEWFIRSARACSLQ